MDDEHAVEQPAKRSLLLQQSTACGRNMIFLLASSVRALLRLANQPVRLQRVLQRRVPIRLPAQHDAHRRLRGAKRTASREASSLALPPPATASLPGAAPHASPREELACTHGAKPLKHTRSRNRTSRAAWRTSGPTLSATIPASSWPCPPDWSVPRTSPGPLCSRSFLQERKWPWAEGSGDAASERCCAINRSGGDVSPC